RRLLAQAANVLPAVVPCWMASPLSVSQLIGADRRWFDVVIFDEASQVLPEDGVPAILRASRVVVAGDRHQLPPTAFFVSGEDGGEESSPADVRAVASLVLEHAAARPGRSRGVITMGLPHARRIEAELARRLRDRPDLRELFDPARPDRFFVKSIERVQGD